MATVYDSKTGAPIQGTPQEITAGLASGAFAFEGGKQVLLKGVDGTVYQADPQQAVNALSNHPDHYSLMSEHEELAHQVSQEEAAKGTLGSIEEGARSFGNQALFGIPGDIADAAATPEEKEKRDLQEDYHSTARTIGGVAGVGASLLAGGELFKPLEAAGAIAERGILPAAEAASAGLTRRLAATAANYATQGAIMSSPKALIQGIVGGDWKQAGETLAWGTGLGAALGGAGKLISEGADAIGSKIQDAVSNPELQDSVKSFSDDRTLKAVGAERGQLNKLDEDRMGELAGFVHEKKLLEPGMTREQVGDRISEAKLASGSKIDDAISSLDGILKKGTPDQDMAADAIKPGELGDAIKNALDTQEMKMPMNADQRAALEKVVESAHMIPTTKVNGQEVVSFEDAQNFVSDLRKKWAAPISKAQNEGGVRGLETVTPLDQLKAASYQVGRDFLHQRADQFVIKADSPELAGQLQGAKNDYAKLAQLEQFASTLDRQNAGNRMVGLTDFIGMGKGPASHALGGVGGALGAVMGGMPGYAIGHAAGKLLGAPMDLLTKHWLEDKGLVYLSALSRKAAAEGPDVFSAVMASEAGKRLQATLDGTSKTIRAMAARSTALAHPKANTFSTLLGNQTGLSKDQQFNRLSDRLTTLSANPQSAIQLVANLSSPFSHASPDLGSAYGAQMLHAMQYLATSLPKQPPSSMPFAPTPKQTISPADKLAFLDKAEIVANPMAALNHVQQGTLSDAHLDAIKTVYPQTYSKMCQSILEFSGSHPDVKLPFRERQSMAKFLGMPLDQTQSPAAINTLQQTYNSNDQSQNPGKQTGKLHADKLPSMGSQFSSMSSPNPGAT